PAGKGKGRAKRLLVVDDDSIQLRLQKAILTNLGYKVTAASNAREALAQAQAHPPDCVVSDVLMPGMDGFQLTSAIRADPHLARVPVVLASSRYSQDEDRELALRIGASSLVFR